MNRLVALGALSAADLQPFHVHEGAPGVCLGTAATQLHWESWAAFDAWLDRLGELAYEARVARQQSANTCCPAHHECWLCTLPVGHDGDHVAGGSGGRVYDTWPQDDIEASA